MQATEAQATADSRGSSTAQAYDTLQRIMFAPKTIAQLIKETGCTEPTIRRHVYAAQEAGLVDVVEETTTGAAVWGFVGRPLRQ